MAEHLIGQQDEVEKYPKANFAKADKTPVDPSIAKAIQIPPIYYWEDIENGVSGKMTMAFQWQGLSFGMSYEIEDDNFVKKEMMRKRLFGVVKESLDVLVHHGSKVLDWSTKNIDSVKVNEQEAIRFVYDPLWAKRVAAFNKLVRIAPITKKKAIKLGLLDAPKKII